MEIATGAPMPDGADAVVMVEETEQADGQRIRIMSPVCRGSTSGAAPPTSQQDR